jgi:hypothetical protein
MSQSVNVYQAGYKKLDDDGIWPLNRCELSARPWLQHGFHQQKLGFHQEDVDFYVTK